MTLHEPLDWDGRTVFYVRCKCTARFQSRARVLINEHGNPYTVTERPCPECQRTDSVLGISTEAHKG